MPTTRYTTVMLLVVVVILLIGVFSPTGGIGQSGRIGFISDRDGMRQIYIIDIDGSNLVNLTSNFYDDRNPSWSPDGKKIVFSSGGNIGPQIYAMNPDGTGQIRLSTSSGSHFFPSWSPDGTKIVFMFMGPGSSDAISWVYTMDADGSNYHDISVTEFDNGWPAWSPGGGEIALSLSDHICVADTEGNDVRTFDVKGFSLAWSPDGERIAFNSSLGGIGVVNLSNGKVQRLISNAVNPNWSPDGSEIAFDLERDGNTDIFLMDTEGGSIRRLTTDPADDWNPCWSPDGTKIAFVSNRDSNNEIYVMNADGTDQVNITNNPADDRDPDWCCRIFQQTEPVQRGSSTQTPPSSERPLSQWVVIFIISLVVIVAIFMSRKILSRRR